MAWNVISFFLTPLIPKRFILLFLGRLSWNLSGKRLLVPRYLAFFSLSLSNSRREPFEGGNEDLCRPLLNPSAFLSFGPSLSISTRNRPLPVDHRPSPCSFCNILVACFSHGNKSTAGRTDPPRMGFLLKRGMKK